MARDGDPLRILLVTESSGWSGGAAQTLLLAQGLRQRNQTVWIACRPQSEIYQRADRDGIPLVPVRIRGDMDPFAIATLVRTVGRLRIQILHAQHPKAHGVSLLAKAVSFRSLPLLVTRRVSFPVSVNTFSALKYQSHKIDQFVAVSDGIRQVLEVGGVEPTRISVIHSGVDPKTFKPSSADVVAGLRKSLGLPAGVPVYTKVANYSDWKGQDTLLEAIRRFITAGGRGIFLFAGRNTDSEEFRNKVSAAGMEPHIRLLGFRTDVADLLSVSDASINAAVAGEGLSGALRESLFLGVPVIATDVSGNCELVEHERTGLLVRPSDPASLASALRRTADHLDQSREMARRGREKVLSSLTVDTMVDKTLNLYKKLLR